MMMCINKLILKKKIAGYYLGDWRRCFKALPQVGENKGKEKRIRENLDHCNVRSSQVILVIKISYESI